MGLEHYYGFVDRSVVDPFLRLTWPEFDKHYGWTDRAQWDSAAEFLTDFALEPQPESPATVKDILARRTLRWTLRHSAPQLFCLMEGLVVHVPAIAARCPGVETSCPDEVVMFLAPAVYGFLQGQISQRTLWAVFALHGCANEPQWLNLPRRQKKIIREALAPSPLPRPMFPWQDETSLDGECFPLGVADTRRFLRFLRRAWDENWPCRYLPSDLEYKAPKNREATIRDCATAGTLLSEAPPEPRQGTCIYWFLG
jgi:hypothetical protein